MMDFRLGNVEVHYYDGMNPNAIFQKGCALAEEYIREDPEYGIFYLRKAALYAAYARQTSDGSSFGLQKSKQQLYTQKAYFCIQDAFRYDATAFYQEYALYIIAICMEAIHLQGTGRVFGGKGTIDFGIDICQKTWDLVTSTGGIEKIPVDCIARFKLAWSRCLDARAEAYGNALKSEAGVETVSLAISMLEELRTLVKQKSFAVDISQSRIDHILNIARNMLESYQGANNR